MNDKLKCKKNTEAIHAGEEREKYADSLTTPIFQTSTFTFKDTDDILHLGSIREAHRILHKMQLIHM